jgi:hypothetical protein
MNRSKFSLFVLSALVFTGLAVISINCAAPGTVSGSVGVNISDQPVWGPTGYDRADYYYIPDIDSYYSVSERQYIYREGTEWRHAAALPSTYNSYDPYHSYKVVVNEERPYQNNDSHRAKYKTFKGTRDQPVIRDSRDHKYYAIKEHPEHENWVKDHQH